LSFLKRCRDPALRRISQNRKREQKHTVPFLYGFENQKIRCTSMDGGSVALCRNRFENDMKLEKNL